MFDLLTRFPPEIVATAAVNGLMMGALYALIALGLTLVYGVLHIINFAHGAILTAAMFAVFLLFERFKLDPYLTLPLLVPLFFLAGYAVQRLLIGPASRGSDSNTLFVTLGLAIIIENSLLARFGSDTRSIDVAYAFRTVDVLGLPLSFTKAVALGGAVVAALLVGIFLLRTDAGRAIRAVAKEKLGAELVGIDVSHVYAMTFGLGAALVAASAAFLMPIFYVTPRAGEAFVLVAFATVVLGGMGSISGALCGGLLLGMVESLSGLYLGESLGQIGIFLIFIVVLLVRPAGLFGARA